ncbi:MAG TPA: DNA polymerase III subunit delta, partial [Burkholderiales bacterium]|nr:DNA polymerase III subunit delta [Burkholderiales bacterium]
MQIRSGELDAHLAKTLAPVYAVHGDEPLLALEAADAVRAAARKRGFSEREVFEVSRGFDWSQFRGSLDSLSLFATKRIVELRLPGGKPGTDG